jgi:hypothetical protein
VYVCSSWRTQQTPPPPHTHSHARPAAVRQCMLAVGSMLREIRRGVMPLTDERGLDGGTARKELLQLTLRSRGGCAHQRPVPFTLHTKEDRCRR